MPDNETHRLQSMSDFMRQTAEMKRALAALEVGEWYVNRMEARADGTYAYAVVRPEQGSGC
jgi:hypothetical protein